MPSIEISGPTDALTPEIASGIKLSSRELTDTEMPAMMGDPGMTGMPATADISLGMLHGDIDVGESHTITIAGEIFTYTVEADDTAESIANGLLGHVTAALAGTSISASLKTHEYDDYSSGQAVTVTQIDAIEISGPPEDLSPMIADIRLSSVNIHGAEMYASQAMGTAGTPTTAQVNFGNLDDNVVGESHTITIDGVDYTHEVVGANETAEDIVSGLLSQLNTGLAGTEISASLVMDEDGMPSIEISGPTDALTPEIASGIKLSSRELTDTEMPAMMGDPGMTGMPATADISLGMLHGDIDVGESHTITIAGEIFTYTVEADDTAESIANGLLGHVTAALAGTSISASLKTHEYDDYSSGQAVTVTQIDAIEISGPPEDLSPMIADIRLSSVNIHGAEMYASQAMGTAGTPTTAQVNFGNLDDNVVGESHTITIDGVDYTHEVVGANETAEDIVSGLLSQLNTGLAGTEISASLVMDEDGMPSIVLEGPTDALTPEIASGIKLSSRELTDTEMPAMMGDPGMTGMPATADISLGMLHGDIDVGESHTITIAGEIFTYTVEADDTAESIANGLLGHVTAALAGTSISASLKTHEYDDYSSGQAVTVTQIDAIEISGPPEDLSPMIADIRLSSVNIHGAEMYASQAMGTAGTPTTAQVNFGNLDDNVVGESHTITIDGVDYTHEVVGANETAEDIVSGLLSQLNTGLAGTEISASLVMDEDGMPSIEISGPTDALTPEIASGIKLSSRELTDTEMPAMMGDPGMTGMPATADISLGMLHGDIDVGESHTITIAGEIFTYTVEADDTAESIANGLLGHVTAALAGTSISASLKTHEYDDYSSGQAVTVTQIDAIEISGPPEDLSPMIADIRLSSVNIHGAEMYASQAMGTAGTPTTAQVNFGNLDDNVVGESHTITIDGVDYTHEVVGANETAEDIVSGLLSQLNTGLAGTEISASLVMDEDGMPSIEISGPTDALTPEIASGIKLSSRELTDTEMSAMMGDPGMTGMPCDGADSLEHS